MRLSLFELAAFQIAFHHTLIKFLTEFIKKIGAAIIFATFHVHIDVVAVLYRHSEDLRESVCQFLYTYFSVVDTVASVESIKEFN